MLQVLHLQVFRTRSGFCLSLLGWPGSAPSPWHPLGSRTGRRWPVLLAGRRWPGLLAGRRRPALLAGRRWPALPAGRRRPVLLAGRGDPAAPQEPRGTHGTPGCYWAGEEGHRGPRTHLTCGRGSWGAGWEWLAALLGSHGTLQEWWWSYCHHQGTRTHVGLYPVWRSCNHATGVFGQANTTVNPHRDGCSLAIPLLTRCSVTQ